MQTERLPADPTAANDRLALEVNRLNSQVAVLVAYIKRMGFNLEGVTPDQLTAEAVDGLPPILVSAAGPTTQAPHAHILATELLSDNRED